MFYFTFTSYIRHCLLLLHAGPVTTAALKRLWLNIITEGVLGGGCQPTSFRYSETTSFPVYRITDPEVIETWVSRKNIFSIFRHVCKTVVKSDLASLCLPVPLYVCMELSGHILKFLLKPVDAIRFLLKWDKNADILHDGLRTFMITCHDYSYSRGWRNSFL